MGEYYEVFEDNDQVDRFEVRDLRKRTRFFIDNIFYDVFVPGFGVTIAMVYVALVRHATKEQKTWPSQTTIGKQLNITKDWVCIQLQVLEYFRLIKKVRLGKACTNRYYLIDDKQWRQDFEVMLEECKQAIDTHKKLVKEAGPGADRRVIRTKFDTLMRTGIGIKAYHSSYKILQEFVSNSKEGKEKVKQSKKRTVVKKSTKNVENDKPNVIHEGTGENTKIYFDKERQSIIHEHY